LVTRVTQHMPLVEPLILTLPENLDSPPIFSLLCGVRVAQSLVFCVVFHRSLFVPFLSAIALSVLDNKSFMRKGRDN
jgi:hypothetical protein